MSGFLWSVAAIVVGTFLVALIYRVWQDNPISRRRDRKRTEDDARRLMAEFRRRADRDHNYIVFIRDAAGRAGVENPDPAVAVLKEWGWIESTEQGTREMFIRLTPEGFQADKNDV